MKGILGRKLGMTQVFTEDGALIPVTVVECLPNVVLQKKTNETDGYDALQLGIVEDRNSNKPKQERYMSQKLVDTWLPSGKINGALMEWQ